LTGLVMLMPFPGPRLILGYLHFLAWAYLWDPVLAVLDIFVKMSAVAQAQAWLASHSASGLSLITYGYIIDQAQWFPAIAGYIGLTAPMWAWAVLKGFEVSVYGLGYMVGNMGANMLNQEMVPQRLAQLTQQERMAREAGFMNAGEASWFAGGYAAAQEASQGWWNRALGQDTLGAVIGGMGHTLGRGLASYRLHGGNAPAMLNSGALGAPAANYVDPSTGMLVRQYADINGNVAKVAMEGAFQASWSLEGAIQQIKSKAQAYDKKIDELVSRYDSLIDSLSAQASEGGSFAKIFKDSKSFKDMAEETKSNAIKHMYEVHNSLKESIKEHFALEDKQAEQLATQILFGLRQEADAKSIIGNFINKITGGTDLRGDAAGRYIHDFVKSDAYQQAKDFVKDEKFEQAMEDIISYTNKKLADETWAREHGFSEEESVQLRDSLSKAVEWAKQISSMESYRDELRQQAQFLSSVKEDLTHMFVRWYAGRMEIDNPAEAGKMLNSIYYNNPKLFNSLANEFLNEIARGGDDIARFLEGKGREANRAATDLNAEAKAVVSNSKSIVETAYKNMYDDLRLKADETVNDVNSALRNASEVKTRVVDQQGNIKKAIEAGAGHIAKNGESIQPPSHVYQNIKEARENPLNMLKHMWNEGPGFRVMMGASTAPYAIRLLEGLGSRINLPGGGGGNVPYGRWNWIGAFLEGAGTVMRMPVTSAGGVAGALGFAPLVALGSYAGTRAVMENVYIGDKNLDQHLYERVFEPALDWIGSKTGWWTPVGR